MLKWRNLLLRAVAFIQNIDFLFSGIFVEKRKTLCWSEELKNVWKSFKINNILDQILWPEATNSFRRAAFEGFPHYFPVSTVHCRQYFSSLVACTWNTYMQWQALTNLMITWPLTGREPWSSGYVCYGWRLMFEKSWVWIPLPYTR